jgi:predicted MPP superfamily phosphohydrolase
VRYANILHISDLHLKSESTGKFNQEQIIGGLIEDIEKISQTPDRPDFIVFSGDVVQAANARGCYDDAYKFISSLATAAGLDDDHVFICPGNHDASRDHVEPNIPLLKSMRGDCSDADGINKFSTNTSSVAYIGDVFKNFDRLQSKFGNRYRVDGNVFLKQYYIRQLNIAVICTNTASLSGSGLGQDVADERNLIFPEMPFVSALKKVPKGAKVIVVAHHPLANLTEANEAMIRPHIFKSVDIYLSGHLHAALPVAVSAPQGQCNFAQSGSLYASRDWWNGYAIVSIAPDQAHQRIKYRKWHPQRLGFGVASELDDEGVLYTSGESRTYWATVTPKVNFQSLEKWRTDILLPFLTDDFGEDFNEVCRNGRFVEPEFEKDNYVKTDNGLEKSAHPEVKTLGDLLDDGDNIVIAAPPESGKTTLAKHIGLTLANQPLSPLQPTIPIVVRRSELKSYLKGIENVARQKTPNLPAQITAQSLLDEGLITFIVDDMSLKASATKDAFDEFVKKYPKCRYVLLTSSVYMRGAGIVPVIVPEVPFSHVKMNQLKASQLLTLIESHGTKDPTTADRLLQRMVREASSLNVPITPVTGTFLIQIYTEDASEPLINRANLVERYIEISLDKFAPREILPSSFDFHNKCDLLSFVSETICRNDHNDLSESEFVALISEYMTTYGLKFSSIDLLNYFIEARILLRNSGFISFRLNAFAEYFSALRMTKNRAFREWILDAERYLSFCNEITFYAAISRNDQDWMEEIFRRFRTMQTEFWAEATDEIKSASLISDFELPSRESGEKILLEVEKKIFETSLEEKDRRAILDDSTEISAATELSMRHQKQLSDDPSEQWMALLTLTSAMLKNMELVPTNLKKQILSEVLHGWLQFLCFTMGLVPSLAKEKRMKIAGIQYLVLYPDEMKVADVARRIYGYLPISIAKVVTHHLGTEKLALQLEDGVGKPFDEISAGQQFMRTAILAQLAVDELSVTVGKAAQSLEQNAYLNSVLIRMLSEIVVRFRLPEAELKSLRMIAADSITRLEGKTGNRAAQRKGQVIEAFTSNRRMAHLGKSKS